MIIVTDLVKEIKENNRTVSDLLRVQHEYHEHRRWSVYEVIENRRFSDGILLEMAGLDPISHADVTEHRGFFPTDNYLRVCILQACVEIEATVTYGEMAKTSKDPLIADVFHHVMKDEVQHRQYFIAFAKALVDSNVYPIKDVLSMAYTWIRPNVGETYGSIRNEQTERKGFVNWWEQVVTDKDSAIALDDNQIRSNQLHEKKVRSVLAAVYEVTGIEVATVKELERAYFSSLTTNNLDRIRHAVGTRDGRQHCAA